MCFGAQENDDKTEDQKVKDVKPRPKLKLSGDAPEVDRRAKENKILFEKRTRRNPVDDSTETPILFRSRSSEENISDLKYKINSKKTNTNDTLTSIDTNKNTKNKNQMNHSKSTSSQAGQFLEEKILDNPPLKSEEKKFSDNASMTAELFPKKNDFSNGPRSPTKHLEKQTIYFQEKNDHKSQTKPSDKQSVSSQEKNDDGRLQTKHFDKQSVSSQEKNGDRLQTKHSKKQSISSEEKDNHKSHMKHSEKQNVSSIENSTTNHSKSSHDSSVTTSLESSNSSEKIKRKKIVSKKKHRKKQSQILQPIYLIILPARVKKDENNCKKTFLMCNNDSMIPIIPATPNHYSRKFRNSNSLWPRRESCCSNDSISSSIQFCQCSETSNSLYNMSDIL